MMEFDDELALPSVQNWSKPNVVKLEYKGAELFLYFLDKYATVMGGGARSMAKSYKNSYRNTLLDRLSLSDIAYIVLIYKSAHDMWAEEIIKSKRCETIQEKKAFQHKAVAENLY